MDEIENTKDKIVKKFYKSLSSLIQIAHQIDPNNVHVEWIRNQVSLVRQVDYYYVIDHVKDKMWRYQSEIISEDEQFFFKENFDEFLNPESDKMIISMISMFKAKFFQLSKKEKSIIWSMIKDMLKNCIEYMKLDV